MNTSYSIQPTPDQLISAALANEPMDLPVEYQPLADKESRSEIVATRLARNLGPLLGVPDPEGPFGERSWLIDYENLTLNEIGRGAPEPPPAVRRRLAQSEDDNSDGFQITGRFVYGKTPNFIVNASLNRYGPDTRAAVTLAGLNRLLEPQTELITETIQSESFQNLAPEQQLHAYSGMVFGAYRLQPLLVFRGVQARAMQRAMRGVQAITPKHMQDADFAQAELPERGNPAPLQPFDFDIFDGTAGHLAPLLPWSRPRAFSKTELIAMEMIKMLRQPGIWKYQMHFDVLTGQETICSIENPATITWGFSRRMLRILGIEPS